jgi:hypothetical protein
VATAALLLQVVLMYATNAVHKSRSEEWMRGDALVSVFDADQFTVLLGTVLADQHVLLAGLGYLWMGLVVLAPLLVLCSSPDSFLERRPPCRHSRGRPTGRFRRVSLSGRCRTVCPT